MAETKKSASTDLALAEDKENALALLDEFLEGDEDTTEDFGQGDFLVPYLRILQSLSKELQKGHQKYIKGAEVGQIINSATKRTWDGETGFWVIPIAFSHRYQAWRPNNGGPADDYGNDDTVYKSLVPNDKGKRINADGNEVTDANQYFVLVVDPETGEYEMGVLSMSGSQAKKARAWNSKLNNLKVKNREGKTVKPKIYFHAWHVTTVPESNEQGNWFGFAIGDIKPVMELPNARELFEVAKATRERIKEGTIKTQVEDADDSLLSDGDEKAF